MTTAYRLGLRRQLRSGLVLEPADGAGANARGGHAGRSAAEMVVEGDGAEEVGDGDAQSGGDEAQGVVGEIAVTVVKGMEERQQGRRLVAPAGDERLVSGNGHGAHLEH